MAAMGYQAVLVPEPLFLYRRHGHSRGSEVRQAEVIEWFLLCARVLLMRWLFTGHQVEGSGLDHMRLLRERNPEAFGGEVTHWLPHLAPGNVPPNEAYVASI